MGAGTEGLRLGIGGGKRMLRDMPGVMVRPPDEAAAAVPDPLVCCCC